MNLILLFPDDFIAADRVRLDGRRAVHVRDVLRAAVGASLRVGLLDDRIGSGVVTALDEAVVELEVHLSESPPPPLPLTLLLALPRPKAMRRILQSVTTLGVKRLFLMNSVRVEKSYWLSPLLEPAAIREQMILGLEQSCDTTLPEVLLRKRFKPFVQDELCALVQESRAFVAHPAANEPCPRSVATPTYLAIGPEGGFVPYEIELLVQNGFRAVSLGPRRLRVEQVIPTLVGRLF